MRYWLYQWGWKALDTLFPPSCGGCGRLGTRWCSECHNRVVRLVPPYCQSCGELIKSGNSCSQCEQSQLSCSAIRSWAEFSGPLRKALHTFKYQRNLGLGDTFSSYLIEFINHLSWHVDLVVPVPLGRERLHNRGYNQAALLAKPLALGTGVDYFPQTLRRKRDTKTQVGLSLAERKLNMLDAFEASAQFVLDKVVLLVDDVMTSGATIESCAVALNSAGARAVYGLTLARAPMSSNQVGLSA